MLFRSLKMEENTATLDISAINQKIERESAFIDLLTMEMNKVIVGQKHMVERLLIGLLGQGHILLEGVPGLAKTLAINTLSQAIHGSFSRIQFTPDLLPADIYGDHSTETEFGNAFADGKFDRNHRIYFVITAFYVLTNNHSFVFHFWIIDNCF